MTKTIATSSPSGVAPTQTVAVALAAIEQIQSAPIGMPRLAVLSGAPGLGKTTALTRLAHPVDINAVYISCRSFETVKSLAELVLRELGVNTKSRWSVPNMFDAACQAFGEHGRPLVVDEADRIAEKGAIELLRDLHDIGQVPILLVGEEHLQRKLVRHHERFHDRVLVWAKAMAADGADFDKLAQHYAHGLAIDAEAKKAVLMHTHGVARRIVTALHNLSEYAKTRGVKTITLADLKGVL